MLGTTSLFLTQTLRVYRWEWKWSEIRPKEVSVRALTSCVWVLPLIHWFASLFVEGSVQILWVWSLSLSLYSGRPGKTIQVEIWALRWFWTKLKACLLDLRQLGHFHWLVHSQWLWYHASLISRFKVALFPVKAALFTFPFQLQERSQSSRSFFVTQTNLSRLTLLVTSKPHHVWILSTSARSHLSNSQVISHGMTSRPQLPKYTLSPFLKK